MRDDDHAEDSERHKADKPKVGDSHKGDDAAENSDKPKVGDSHKGDDSQKGDGDHIDAAFKPKGLGAVVKDRKMVCEQCQVAGENLEKAVSSLQNLTKSITSRDFLDTEFEVAASVTTAKKVAETMKDLVQAGKKLKDWLWYCC